MTDNDKRVVSIRLDTPVFARLWAEAQTAGVSVSETARRRLEVSLREGDVSLAAGVVEEALRRPVHHRCGEEAGFRSGGTKLMLW